MKKMKFINKALLVLTGIVALASCVKKEGKEIALEQLDLANKAIIQVFNASIPSASTDPRRNYVYVNSRPVTGAPLAYGSVFPAATGFAVEPGYTAFLIRDTISTSLQPPISFAENFESGKAYTIFMYDTFTTIKQKTVQTNIVIPSDTTARVRFANFVYHPTQINGVDIFSKKRNEFVAQNLLPTSVTEFIPYASSLNDTLYVTETGNPSNRLDTLNGFNPVRKRSYTLIFRGRWRTNEMLITPTTSAPNPRVLSAFANN